jgi:predicted AAA+ superfamily ATPase
MIPRNVGAKVEADLARQAAVALIGPRQVDKLVILDEIHRVPALFEALRGIIDAGRRAGHRTGRFLILGSATIDLLVDLLLVRRLPPFHANVGKRLVKSPKTYVRDNGLTHALLDIETS